MTSEESILFLGKTAQKLDQLASAFLEVKLRQEEASEKDRKAKEKKPSRKDGKEMARDEKGRFQRKEIKISEPSQNLKMLAEMDKEAKKKNKLNLQEKAPKVAENLTSTERKRWENIGTILGTAFKKIFEGRQKVTRQKGTGKEIQDLEFIENQKLENKMTSFFKKLLAALAFLSGATLGFISDIMAKAKQIYMLIKEFMIVFEGKLLELLKTIKNSKFMEFVKGVYQSLREKFFSLIEEIKNSKFVEFVKGVYKSLKEKFFGLIEEIKNSKFGRFVTELYESIKSKFFNLIKEINNSKLGRFVSETFEALKNKFFGIMQEIKNSKLGNIVADIFQALKNKFTSIASAVGDIKIGEVVGGIFKGISTKILQIFETIGGYFSRIGRILDVFAAGKGPLLFLEKMLAPFPEFLQFIIRGPLKMLLQIFGKGVAFGKFLTERFPVIYLVIETIIGLFNAFTDKLMEGKSFIQKLLTGIIYGITSFVNFFEFIGLKLVDFEEVRDRVDKVFSAFKDGFFKGLLEIINQVVTFVLGMGSKVGAWIVGWFDKKWGEALYDIAKTAKNPLDMFVKWWDLTKIKMVEYITEPFKKMIDYIKGLFIQPFEVVKNFFFGAIEGLTGAFQPVLNILKDTVTFIPNFFGNLLNKVKSLFDGLDPSSILSTLKDIIGFPVHFIGNMFNKVKSLFDGLDPSSILSTLKDIIGFPVHFIGNMFNKVKSLFDGLDPSSILSTLKDIIGFPVHFIGNMFNKVKSLFDGLDPSSILSTLKDIIGFPVHFIGNMFNKVKSLFDGLDPSSILSTLKDIIGFPVHFIGNMFNKVKSLFDGLDPSSILSTLKDIIGFPVHFIGNMIDYIKGFFSNINMDSVVNGIKTFFKYTPIGMILDGIDYIKGFFSNLNIDSVIKGIKQFFDYTPIGMLINNFETIKNFFGDTFGKVKNFFTFVQQKFHSIFGFIGDLLSKIFNFIRDKAKKIPLIGKLFEGEDTGAKQETYVENKNEKIPLLQNPFEASQEQPNQFMQSFQSPENEDFQSQSMFQVPEMTQPNEANNLFAMEKQSSSPEGFGDVKTGIEDLNKNSSVYSKIAVDQLREIKQLNKKMEELVGQLTSSRAMVVNNVRNSSVNSFLQPTTINSFRSSYRE